MGQVVGQEVLQTGSVEAQPPTRGVLFLSHASPEENTFVTWLAAQLVSAGYEVWCDVTKLLGGERFWQNIDEAIEAHTFRFLYVSTMLTHTKPGAKRELKLALEAQDKHDLGDFIIPLKIDEFPFDSMHERIHGLNIMRFDQGWSSALANLLKLLEREGAPKSPLATAACINDWHRRSLQPARLVQIGDEQAYSNWFRVRRQPKGLWFHDLGLTGKHHLERAVSGFSFPYRLHGERLVTFAQADEVQDLLGPVVSVRASEEVRTATFASQGSEDLQIAADDASNILTDLLGQAWAQMAQARGLLAFEMASGRPAWFFPNGKLQKNQAHFKPPNGSRRTYRQLVGNKTKRTPEGLKVPDGYWHYAVSADVQLRPFPRILLRHHVIFTDDGTKPWTSAERMLRARRRVCKDWWNAAWRDRLFAFCAVLGDENQILELPVSRGAPFAISMTGMTFTNPRRFFEDNENGVKETDEIELVEDLDEEDGDDDDAN